MNYNYNRNDERLNNEPINEVPKNKMWFAIHIVIGLILILVYVGMMNTDWINSFLVFEKLDVIKKIYFVGVILYIIFAIMSQKEDELHSKKFKDIIVNGIKLMVWWAIVIGALTLLSLYYIFVPAKGYGLEEEITINNITIPTLYKYSKDEEVFAATSFQSLPEDERSNFVTVAYKNPIPKVDMDVYISALENYYGYEMHTIQGTTTYMLDIPEKRSYACVIINNASLSYGVLTYEEYQMALDGTLFIDDTLNPEENNF